MSSGSAQLAQVNSPFGVTLTLQSCRYAKYLRWVRRAKCSSNIEQNETASRLSSEECEEVSSGKGCTRAQPLKPRVFTNYLHALHVAESLVVCLETARWKRDCKSASRKIAHINALVSLFCTLTLEHS